MHTVDIKVQTNDESVELPFYATDGAAGADVRAHLEEELIIEPGSTAAVPTGLRFDIPDGYEVQVRPRSGLAFKHQVTVLNTPGTIDSDYRGEIVVILINHGKQSFVITPNMRIAQIVVAPVCQADFLQVQHVLSDTDRGEGRFGHTGQS